MSPTNKKDHKYIFVIGGVMSGVGKGIAASSIAKILNAYGHEVSPVKVDPYLNVDAGTMNPTEHGEVFVLKTGLETDQDMGNYERFLGKDLGNENYITSGMVYKHVIEKERALGYRGKCVEAVPHIRDEIIRRIEASAEHNGAAISLIEIGGTIGDYQNIMFIEAARVMKIRHPSSVLFIMVSYLPIPGGVEEMKTKPTQNAVRQLNSYGVQPDIIIARSKIKLDKKRKEKIAISCSIDVEHVISAPDIDSIYEVPLNFEKDRIGLTILDELGLAPRRDTPDLSPWRTFVEKIKKPKGDIKIAVVGKYFDTGDFVLSDAYLSVIEAIKFSAYNLGMNPEIAWINAKDFEHNQSDEQNASGENNTTIDSLKGYDGILVPGGFGETGIEGKIRVIRYARENKIPYFGLCYGMQLAVIEYARHVLGIENAHTVEVDSSSEYAVIDVMPDQKEKIEKGKMGGTMRLGAYPCIVKPKTIAAGAYKEEKIEERHRHRYEVNPAYIERLEKGGLVFSGTSPDKTLMEIAELPKDQHPFFLGTQFHPELQARPLTPHPLFTAFIKAAIEKRS